MRPNGTIQGGFALLVLCAIPLLAFLQGNVAAPLLAVAIGTAMAATAAILTAQGRWGMRALTWNATALFPVACTAIGLFWALPTSFTAEVYSESPRFTGVFMGLFVAAVAHMIAPLIAWWAWPKADEAGHTLATLLAAQGVVPPRSSDGRWCVTTSLDGSGLVLGEGPWPDDAVAQWPRPWRAPTNRDPRAEQVLKAFTQAYAGYAWPSSWLENTLHPMMFSHNIAVSMKILDDLAGKPTNLWLPEPPTSAHQRLALLARMPNATER